MYLLIIRFSAEDSSRQLSSAELGLRSVTSVGCVIGA